MTFRITGLPADTFRPLFGLTDDELARHGARRYVAHAKPGFPDRVELALYAVREGVVADADLADAGLIFGTGFAPFRGGPLHYLQTRGRQAS